MWLSWNRSCPSRNVYGTSAPSSGSVGRNCPAKDCRWSLSGNCSRHFWSRMRMIRVLFICHVNILRSPMAEFVMKALVKKAGVEGQTPHRIRRYQHREDRQPDLFSSPPQTGRAWHRQRWQNGPTVKEPGLRSFPCHGAGSGGSE